MEQPKPYRKILLCITVDWFALSHFTPLIRLLTRLASDVVIVTQVTDRKNELTALGLRVIHMDYHRATMNPVQEALNVRQLTRIMAAEQPDAVHLIAMKPVTIGGLAARLAAVPRVIVHMTGLGHIAIARTRRAQLISRLVCRHIAGLMKREHNWLFVENPDDLKFLEVGGVRPGARVSILGGAGIDAEHFTATSDPDNEPLIAACAGRMIHSKGLDVLVDAYDILCQRGIALDIELYGRLDDGNPEAITGETIDQWTKRPGVTWLGNIDDVRDVWRRANISVLPARSREGMPRALLEAAACAKPLVVTDVSGCRHFVRHGQEGLVVPPEDAMALADALAKLVADGSLRQRLGKAARARVLDGFTEADVVSAIASVYEQLAET